MSKRSSAVAEVETQLCGLVGAFGGLGDEHGTEQLVTLMQLTHAPDARELLLKVILATTDQYLLQRCISQDANGLLCQWVREHCTRSGREDKQLLHTLLSCLHKLNPHLDLTQQTQSCSTVGLLCKHADSSISSKATAIVTLWKRTSTPLAKSVKSVPGEPAEPLKNYTLRKLRYSLINLSLSNVDGRKTPSSRPPSSSTDRTNLLRPVPRRDLLKTWTLRLQSSASMIFASAMISSRRKR